MANSIAGASPVEVDENWGVRFGIGCWDIGLRRSGSFNISGREYVAALTDALEAIESLDHLRIVLDPVVDLVEPIDEGALTEVDGGRAIMGFGLLSEVSFDLNIPFRRQNELGAPWSSEQTKTRTFRVHMRYPFYSPVAFVELVGDRPGGMGASGVKVVREYLEVQLAETGDALAYESVGPSPFHADLEIRIGKDAGADGPRFKWERLEAYGYDSIVFWWGDTSIPTSEISGRLFKELEEELDVFYLIASNNLKKHSSWARLEELAGDVVARLKESGVWKRTIGMRKQSRDLAALYCDLVEFRSREIAFDQEERSAVRTLYDRSSEVVFRNAIDAAMKGRRVYSWEQLRDLSVFMEGRRSKSVEMTLIFMSALAGAVVGSSITLLST